ncbi:hypothetical protein G7K_2723-t1 [Saitoella complicata NRRL Y-17804]|uniref:Shugoshin C-terminal domain-containing protein n=1 Tax=Saitoella complicata (strain BCRC 22490 / CBS 7301 / JCM 7358 / NBRC 10748 / NRRL Y-17804) TaxID=698492 RepID=A0A0E9NGL9_SAICN|nr:hypothetical protein G7K_2723-t1 [Saitoella complicata NRRL Y-17804]
MVRVAEQPPVDSMESFKRQHTLQNRQIIKVNTQQAFRIRELESEVSALACENLDLRTTVIQLQEQIERDRKKSMVANIDATKCELERLMRDMSDAIGRMGKGAENMDHNPLPAPTEDTSTVRGRRIRRNISRSRSRSPLLPDDEAYFDHDAMDSPSKPLRMNFGGRDLPSIDEQEEARRASLKFTRLRRSSVNLQSAPLCSATSEVQSSDLVRESGAPSFVDVTGPRKATESGHERARPGRLTQSSGKARREKRVETDASDQRGYVSPQSERTERRSSAALLHDTTEKDEQKSRLFTASDLREEMPSHVPQLSETKSSRRRSTFLPHVDLGKENTMSSARPDLVMNGKQVKTAFAPIMQPDTNRILQPKEFNSPVKGIRLSVSPTKSPVSDFKMRTSMRRSSAADPPNTPHSPTETDDGASPPRRAGRARKEVNYAQPSLRSKMRRDYELPSDRVKKGSKVEKKSERIVTPSSGVPGSDSGIVTIKAEPDDEGTEGMDFGSIPIASDDFTSGSRKRRTSSMHYPPATLEDPTRKCSSELLSPPSTSSSSEERVGQRDTLRTTRRLAAAGGLEDAALLRKRRQTLSDILGTEDGMKSMSVPTARSDSSLRAQRRRSMMA